MLPPELMPPAPTVSVTGLPAVPSTALNVITPLLLDTATPEVSMPPLLLGVINRTKAKFAGRNGPPLLQPYYDIIRLMRKGSVFSTTTTWVFRAGPVVGLVAAALAVLMIPLANSTAPISFKGDLILLVYLLALSRFFTAAAALDTGSPFEGMGRRGLFRALLAACRGQTRSLSLTLAAALSS